MSSMLIKTRNDKEKALLLLSFSCFLIILIIFPPSSIAGISEYPSASNPDFTWLSTPTGLLRYDKRSDEWTFASTHPLLRDATIHDIGVDEDFIWIATDKGIANAVIGSAEWSVYTSSDGLPDDNVTSLAFHSDYVWAGTAKGIARFDKYIEEWESIQIPELSDGARDITVLGDTVWVILPSAIFSVEVESGEAQRHSVEGDFLEVVLIGGDVWFLGENAAKRYAPAENLWRRYGTEQGYPKDPEDVEIEGKTVWIASPAGICSYDSKLDRWTDFLPLRSSPIGVDAKGVAPDGRYLWGLTTRGVGRYDRTTGAWRRFSELDGLIMKEKLSIMVDGNYVFVVGAESIGIYYKTRDSWRIFRYESIEMPETKAGRQFISIETSGLTLTPSNSVKFSLSGISSFGFKMKPEIGNFDFWNSLSLHGELPSQRSISGVYDDLRERRFRLKYQGAPKDMVREITVGEAQFRPFSSSLLDKEEVLGAGAKLSKGAIRSELWFAQRRGIPYVDFLRGKLGEREIFSYQLSHKGIIPYSERLFVDGKLMQRNVHYFIDYTLGWMIFNVPDLIDPDSRIRVEYQYSESSAENEERFSSIQLETDQINDKAHFGAIFTDFPSRRQEDGMTPCHKSSIYNELTTESNRYLATSGFARWENGWLSVQPEIAYAHPDSDPSLRSRTCLAGAFMMELRSEKANVKAEYRRFSPDFPSTIRRLTEFGKLTDEMNFETSARLWDTSSFRFRLNSGNSQIGDGNFAIANFKLNPQGLPSFMLSGRYDVLNTLDERDKRIGAKIGVGYDLPEKLLSKLRLSELGFSSRFGTTRRQEDGMTPCHKSSIYNGLTTRLKWSAMTQSLLSSDDASKSREELGLNKERVSRYDAYWKVHAGIKAGASANVYQRFSHLPDYTVRRTVLGMQIFAIPGINSSLYLDLFKEKDKSSPTKEESLLSTNLSVFPGNWSSLLQWLDILSGYTVIDRSGSDRIRSTLFRPTVRLSQKLRFLANCIWNEPEGTSFDSELLYTPDFGRIGFVSGAKKREKGWEKKFMPWCEFLMSGTVNRLTLSFSQTPDGNLTWSPEHLIRHYMHTKWVLRSVYFANSLSFIKGEADQISESLLVELSTNFSLTFRLSGTVVYDLDNDKTNVNFLFKGYAKL